MGLYEGYVVLGGWGGLLLGRGDESTNKCPTSFEKFSALLRSGSRLRYFRVGLIRVLGLDIFVGFRV